MKHLNHTPAAQGQQHKRLLSRLILALFFLMPLVGLGQTDYSGVYFIANKIWNGSNTSSQYYYYSESTPEYNWYLVPGADPQISHFSDAYFNDQYVNTTSGNTDDYTGDNYGDPEQPFLTTYRTNRNNNSVWILKKTGDYYYIIHAITGKYVKYEPPYKSFPLRKTMHLEAVDTDTPGDDFKYSITTNTSNGITGLNIAPKNKSGNYFNPAGDNWDRYYGTNGGNKYPYSQGMVGLWTADLDKGSSWPKEEALLPAPTIVYDADNDKFTISYDIIPAGFTILYTTDGSDPTIGGATTQTYTNESVITLETIGSNPLKAVVEKYGFILTRTASIQSPSDPSIEPTPGDCRNTVTITADEGTSVYYTIDGTEPTNNSSFYTVPFVLSTDATVKAIAYNGGLHSGVTTLNYSPNYSATPTITQNGATITISGAGSIYYTTDGNEPNTGSTPYTGPFPLTGNSGDVITIKAVAKDGDKELSCVVEKTITMGYFIGDLDDLENISSHLDDLCILTDDINASSLSSSISGFTGTFDGDYYTISGLTKPLFSTLDGATVKNLKLANVNITTGTNVGAICNEATGVTKIYNCGILSGSVSGTNNVGGLVGLINSGSSVRVVNCYNYADVRGGNFAAGIVGKNEGTVGNVRIALCMMYGSVTTATNISPVYCGNHTNNVQNFTEYNYYLYSDTKDADGIRIEKIPYTAYNDQMAIDKEEYLTRFPFYRHILNNHRELGAFFLFGSGSQGVGNITSDQIAEMGHWVLKKGTNVPKYPVVEKWLTNTHRTTVDIAANLPSTTDDYAGKLLTSMGSSGYLTVTVIINSMTITSSLQLPITDMDTLNYDFTWGKVVLPFANEFSGWTPNYAKICTGWKITSVTKGSTSYTESNVTSSTNYNFADRDNPQKDIYDANNPYIFAQGGNYIVPYGVTAITIEANFANAFYLSDPAYDMGYNTSYDDATPLGGSVPTDYHEKTVYTSLSTLVGALAATTNPHDQAIVLVGNFHYNMKTLGGPILNTGKAVTIMSVDEDCNQEPDYGWYSYMNAARPAVPPLRFDFVPNIPIGMSSHVTGSTYFPGVSIWKVKGWFELTETCMSIMHQCEIESKNFNTENGKGNNRWIANSGYFTQIVRSKDGVCNKLSYIQIGGNAYVKELYPGNHSTTTHTNKVVPINVTGGEIEECFMTGYHVGGKLEGNNIYFWCAGGRIHKFLGAYMETPVQASGQTGGVNMEAKIDHARIFRFFGGGTSSAARITGNIKVTINNSLVDFYCGGPEFGDMDSGKTVTTNATGTTFRKYYGAGFGGTSLTNVFINEINNQSINGLNNNNGNTVFPQAFTFYTDRRLGVNSTYGIGTAYKFEYIIHSTGQYIVPRWYVGYSRFSLATTGDVTNNLTNCTIENDFYGAGCQGKVNGTVTSILTDCIVNGSAFGGGYQATANDVPVYPTTQPTYAHYNCEKGLFTEFSTITPDTWQWEQGTGDDETYNESNQTLYSQKTSIVNLSELGNVTGNITITLKGTTSMTVGGNVFGGGNKSKSLSNTTVKLQEKATVNGNVYGGGNEAEVLGNASVIIQNP